MQMLANLIQQFYQLYQGQHKGLDLEMNKLLSMLNQAADTDKELSSYYTNIEKYQLELFTELSQHQHQLQNSINDLYHVNAVPPHLRQDAKDSTPAFPHNLAPLSITSILDCLDMMVKLNQGVVGELNRKFDNSAQDNTQLIESYVAQLIKLSDELRISAALRDELIKIINNLKHTKTSGDLCYNFNQLVKLLVKNINNEKEASKYFLDILNKALLDVRSLVADSSCHQSDSFKKRNQWDKNLTGHVENISNQLDEHHYTTEVQSIISGEIDDILKAIKDKERFDKLEYQALSNNFKQMEQRLKTVEEQAQGYKSQLDEQKILSMQDSLTKLPNRAALDEKFADEFKRAQQLNTPLWVVVADLDLFKRINDNFGHTAGDKTLQTVASLLSRSLRESEFIARFGGEEFVILVPEINKAAIKKMLNRVRENIKSIPFKFKDSSIRVTISLGATKVKLSDPGEYFAFERADQALYKAKKQGRDRVIIL